MPKRSPLTRLPPELKRWLEDELLRRGFSDYRALAADLQAKGVAASKSGLHRYGSNLERRLSAIRASTKAAALIAKDSPDDADDRSAAVISLIQTDIFETLVTLQDVDREVEPAKRAELLAKLAKNAATLTRASVAQKRHAIEIRTKAEAAADKVARLAKKGGMSAGTVDAIKREILGIAA